ncbi:MAG: protein kinase [Anaerolineae bacterium]
MDSLENGTILHDRYEVLEQIGRGGFGAVYRAMDKSLNRICAVKENLNDTDESNRQFHREASLLAGLNHRSLPRVTDHFRMDGQGQYLVMDFIEGKSLQELLAAKKGPLNEDDIARWMIQVTQALNYLHNRQPPIIHRDIKPANIIVNQDGRAVLVDFGISKVVEGGGQTTMGARAITPGFSPPEQYGVSSTDNRSDLYSLGATMYACITGKNPPESIQMMMGQASLSEPESLNNAISRPLSDVIRHSMILAMGSRYQSAVEMEGALKQATTEPLPEQPKSADEFAPTIDPPELPQGPQVVFDPDPPSNAIQQPVSAPAVPASNPISAPPSTGSTGRASRPTPSKKLKKKNTLPIWAWIIIGIGLSIIMCIVGIGLLTYLIPTPETPAANDGNTGEIQPVISQPIEVDGFVINWRMGGNLFTQSNNEAGEQARVSHFALDHNTGTSYAITVDQIIVIDKFGNLIDQAVYSAAFSVQDMTIGPDGNLYVLDRTAAENFVRVFNPDLEFLREIGSRDNGDNTMSSSPSNLVFGPDGLLWMLDYRASEDLGYDQLFKLDPVTGDVVELLQLDSNYSISDQLIQGANTKLYLLLGSDSTAIEVDAQFGSVREITVPESNFVDSLGVGADGTFYAGVAQDQVFIHFDQDGNLIKQFGDRSSESDVGYPPGIFYNIEKIELFDNNLFVIDESVTYSYLVSIFP